MGFLEVAPFALFLGIAGIFVLLRLIRVIREYERAVVFRLGKVRNKALGPGLVIVLPILDSVRKVDMRTITLDVPSQEAITQDNVTVRVNAVVYFQAVDPVAAIVNIEDYRRATSQIAQTSLRNVIGQSSLDQLLQDREAINDRLQVIIDEATEPWGIQVSIVEISDVELNPQMVRAMARQAEAERERRAKIIHAEGELQASQMLAEAAGVIGREPGAMTLRYLQTLVEIGVENNTTTIFPVPVEILGTLGGLMNKDASMPTVELNSTENGAV